MRNVEVRLHRDFAIGSTNPRLFGAFLEHLGRCVYGGIFEPGHPTADAKGFRKDVLALVPMDDLALLEKLEDEADVRAARAALAEIERTGEKPIPWEQVKAKLAAKRLRKKKG